MSFSIVTFCPFFAACWGCKCLAQAKQNKSRCLLIRKDVKQSTEQAQIAASSSVSQSLRKQPIAPDNIFRNPYIERYMYVCILDSRSNTLLRSKIFTLQFSYIISSAEVSTLFRNQDHLHTQKPAVAFGKPSLKHHNVSMTTILQRTSSTSPSV